MQNIRLLAADTPVVKQRIEQQTIKLSDVLGIVSGDAGVTYRLKGVTFYSNSVANIGRINVTVFDRSMFARITTTNTSPSASFTGTFLHEWRSVALDSAITAENDIILAQGTETLLAVVTVEYHK